MLIFPDTDKTAESAREDPEQSSQHCYVDLPCSAAKGQEFRTQLTRSIRRESVSQQLISLQRFRSVSVAALRIRALVTTIHKWEVMKSLDSPKPCSINSQLCHFSCVLCPASRFPFFVDLARVCHRYWRRALFYRILFHFRRSGCFL